MKSKISQLIAIILLLLVTGVFWGTWFALSRSIETFSAAEFIHIGKTIIQNVAVPMSIIFPACLLFIILSIVFYPQKKSISFYLMIVAFLLLIVTLLITLLVEVPIDNQIKQWTVATIPSDWKSIRHHWESFHALRTFTSLAGFISFAIAMSRD